MSLGVKKRSLVGLLLVILKTTVYKDMTRYWDSRSKEALFLALVLFYKSRPIATFIYNRTAISRQVCCSAGDWDLHWCSRCCATLATAAHVAWDEFWRRRRARKRDSAERAAIFLFLFFWRIQVNQCAPDEKQRSNKVHPYSRRSPLETFSKIGFHAIPIAWIENIVNWQNSFSKFPV